MASSAENWVEKFNKEKNRKYWKNLQTGKVSWTPPASLGDISEGNEDETTDDQKAVAALTTPSASPRADPTENTYVNSPSKSVSFQVTTREPAATHSARSSRSNSEEEHALQERQATAVATAVAEHSDEQQREPTAAEEGANAETSTGGSETLRQQIQAMCAVKSGYFMKKLKGSAGSSPEKDKIYDNRSPNIFKSPSQQAHIKWVCLDWSGPRENWKLMYYNAQQPLQSSIGTPTLLPDGTSSAAVSPGQSLSSTSPTPHAPLSKRKSMLATLSKSSRDLLSLDSPGNTQEQGKYILLSNIDDLYLDPPPAASFRVYTEGSSVVTQFVVKSLIKNPKDFANTSTHSMLNNEDNNHNDEEGTAEGNERTHMASLWMEALYAGVQLQQSYMHVTEEQIDSLRKELYDAAEPITIPDFTDKHADKHTDKHTDTNTQLNSARSVGSLLRLRSNSADDATNTVDAANTTTNTGTNDGTNTQESAVSESAASPAAKSVSSSTNSSPNKTLTRRRTLFSMTTNSLTSLFTSGKDKSKDKNNTDGADTTTDEHAAAGTSAAAAGKAGGISNDKIKKMKRASSIDQMGFGLLGASSSSSSGGARTEGIKPFGKPANSQQSSQHSGSQQGSHHSGDNANSSSNTNAANNAVDSMNLTLDVSDTVGGSVSDAIAASVAATVASNTDTQSQQQPTDTRTDTEQQARTDVPAYETVPASVSVSVLGANKKKSVLDAILAQPAQPKHTNITAAHAFQANLDQIKLQHQHQHQDGDSSNEQTLNVSAPSSPNRIRVDNHSRSNTPSSAQSSGNGKGKTGSPTHTLSKQTSAKERMAQSAQTLANTLKPPNKQQQQAQQAQHQSPSAATSATNTQTPTSAPTKGPAKSPSNKHVSIFDSSAQTPHIQTPDTTPKAVSKVTPPASTSTGRRSPTGRPSPTEEEQSKERKREKARARARYLSRSEVSMYGDINAALRAAAVDSADVNIDVVEGEEDVSDDSDEGDDVFDQSNIAIRPIHHKVDKNHIDINNHSFHFSYVSNNDDDDDDDVDANEDINVEEAEEAKQQQQQAADNMRSNQNLTNATKKPIPIISKTRQTIVSGSGAITNPNNKNNKANNPTKQPQQQQQPQDKQEKQTVIKRRASLMDYFSLGATTNNSRPPKRSSMTSSGSTNNMASNSGSNQSSSHEANAVNSKSSNNLLASEEQEHQEPQEQRQQATAAEASPQQQGTDTNAGSPTPSQASSSSAAHSPPKRRSSLASISSSSFSASFRGLGSSFKSKSDNQASSSPSSPPDKATLVSFSTEPINVASSDGNSNGRSVKKLNTSPSFRQRLKSAFAIGSANHNATMSAGEQRPAEVPAQESQQVQSTEEQGTSTVSAEIVPTKSATAVDKRKSINDIDDDDGNDQAAELADAQIPVVAASAVAPHTPPRVLQSSTIAASQVNSSNTSGSAAKKQADVVAPTVKSSVSALFPGPSPDDDDKPINDKKGSKPTERKELLTTVRNRPSSSDEDEGRRRKHQQSAAVTKDIVIKALVDSSPAPPPPPPPLPEDTPPPLSLPQSLPQSDSASTSAPPQSTTMQIPVTVSVDSVLLAKTLHNDLTVVLALSHTRTAGDDTNNLSAGDQLYITQTNGGIITKVNLAGFSFFFCMRCYSSAYYSFCGLDCIAGEVSEKSVSSFRLLVRMPSKQPGSEGQLGYLEFSALHPQDPRAWLEMLRTQRLTRVKHRYSAEPRPQLPEDGDQLLLLGASPQRRVRLSDSGGSKQSHQQNGNQPRPRSRERDDNIRSNSSSPNRRLVTVMDNTVPPGGYAFPSDAEMYRGRRKIIHGRTDSVVLM
jgi:hypothetical protein